MDLNTIWPKVRKSCMQPLGKPSKLKTRRNLEIVLKGGEGDGSKNIHVCIHGHIGINKHTCEQALKHVCKHACNICRYICFIASFLQKGDEHMYEISLAAHYS